MSYLCGFSLAAANQHRFWESCIRMCVVNVYAPCTSKISHHTWYGAIIYDTPAPTKVLYRCKNSLKTRSSLYCRGSHWQRSPLVECPNDARDPNFERMFSCPICTPTVDSSSSFPLLGTKFSVPNYPTKPSTSPRLKIIPEAYGSNGTDIFVPIPIYTVRREILLTL